MARGLDISLAPVNTKFFLECLGLAARTRRSGMIVTVMSVIIVVIESADLIQCVAPGQFPVFTLTLTQLPHDHWSLVTTLMTQDTHIPCSQTGVTPLMILTWDPFNDPVMIPYHLKWPPFNTQTLLSLTFKSNLSFHALSKRWATP